MNMHMNRCRKRGFTLIELLVVVAIIVTLIAILLPSLGKAREQAKTTICLSNLKSLAMAMNVYAAEFDGSMVPWAKQTDAATGTYDRPYWDFTIFRSFSGEYREAVDASSTTRAKIFLCPAVTKFPATLPAVPQYRNYNINAVVSGSEAASLNRKVAPYKIAAVNSPAQVLMISERESMWPLNDRTQTSGVTTTSGLTSRRAIDLPMPIHSVMAAGGNQTGNVNFARATGLLNAAMMDGHAESWKWTRLTGTEMPTNFKFDPTDFK